MTSAFRLFQARLVLISLQTVRRTLKKAPAALLVSEGLCWFALIYF